MVPELVIAVLACARVGAIQLDFLLNLINDCNCNLVITADGAFRGAKIIDLKSIVDESLLTCTSVNRVIVLERTKFLEGRDV